MLDEIKRERKHEEREIEEFDCGLLELMSSYDTLM
jgi:hypothetical protein